MPGIGAYRSAVWLQTAIAVLGVNLAGAYVVLQSQSTWTPGSPGAGGSSVFIRRLYDGSVVQYRLLYSGGLSPILLAGPSASGLLQVWWPVAASIGASLLILGFAWFCTRRKSAVVGARPRVTMNQAMVFVGLASFCLWLFRFDIVLLLAGLFVGSLLVHAAYRRKALITGIKGGREAGQTLARIGVAGYTIAVVLALVWVICILVWDSYQPGHR